MRHIGRSAGILAETSPREAQSQTTRKKKIPPLSCKCICRPRRKASGGGGGKGPSAQPMQVYCKPTPKTGAKKVPWGGPWGLPRRTKSLLPDPLQASRRVCLPLIVSDSAQRERAAGQQQPLDPPRQVSPQAECLGLDEPRWEGGVGGGRLVPFSHRVRVLVCCADSGRLFLFLIGGLQHSVLCMSRRKHRPLSEAIRPSSSDRHTVQHPTWVSALSHAAGTPSAWVVPISTGSVYFPQTIEKRPPLLSGDGPPTFALPCPTASKQLASIIARFSSCRDCSDPGCTRSLGELVRFF